MRRIKVTCTREFHLLQNETQSNQLTALIFLDASLSCQIRFWEFLPSHFQNMDKVEGVDCFLSAAYIHVSFHTKVTSRPRPGRNPAAASTQPVDPLPTQILRHTHTHTTWECPRLYQTAGSELLGWTWVGAGEWGSAASVRNSERGVLLHQLNL